MTVELFACYHLADELHATVVLKSDRVAGMTLSILHERFAGDCISYDFTGFAEQRLDLVSGESLTIIARTQGRIVASLVNEVDCRDSSRLLLHPRGGYNLFIHQDREKELILSLPPERTAATARLADLVTVVEQSYPAHAHPRVVRDFWPLLQEAIRLNDEEHSRAITSLFCQTLEDRIEPVIQASIQAVLQS